VLRLARSSCACPLRRLRRHLPPGGRIEGCAISSSPIGGGGRAQQGRRGPVRIAGMEMPQRQMGPGIATGAPQFPQTNGARYCYRAPLCRSLNPQPHGLATEAMGQSPDVCGDLHRWRGAPPPHGLLSVVVRVTPGCPAIPLCPTSCEPEPVASPASCFHTRLTSLPALSPLSPVWRCRFPFVRFDDWKVSRFTESAKPRFTRFACG
jgi:hypothetical protein